jgi:hypothetical protein
MPERDNPGFVDDRRYSSDANRPVYNSTPEDQVETERERIVERNATPPVSQYPETQVERERIVERNEVTTSPVVRSDVEQRRYDLARLTQFIYLLTTILEVFLAIRFVLKLIAANPSAGFAQFIYGMTDVFLVAFTGLTATPSAAGAVLEIPTIIAMIVYAFLAWGIVRIIWILFDRPVVRT